MKMKNEKNQVVQFEKTYFLSCSFLAVPLALHRRKMKKNKVLQFEKTYFLSCSCLAAPLALHRRKMKKKKTSFAIRKNVFSFQLFFGCSFGFAFQRRFVELERALL
jgi:hypothetical protein